MTGPGRMQYASTWSLGLGRNRRDRIVLSQQPLFPACYRLERTRERYQDSREIGVDVVGPDVINGM